MSRTISVISSEVENEVEKSRYLGLTYFKTSYFWMRDFSTRLTEIRLGRNDIYGCLPWLTARPSDGAYREILEKTELPPKIL